MTSQLALKGAAPRLNPAAGPGNGPLRTAGLFAGVGGIELGLERAGHRTAFLCEIDAGASAVLEKRFPGLPLHDDITTLGSLPSGTDLLAAGFPCQDLSQAGATAGIAGTQSGLVGHVFRLLRERPVPWVLVENVSFMLQLARGEAMEVLVSEFESLGYRWAYRTVNSMAFGLPQRRERVFFLASLEEDPANVLFADDEPEPAAQQPVRSRALGFYWTEGVRGLGAAVDSVPTLKGGSTIGIPSPPAIVLPWGRVVTPDIRDAERLQGFDADWTAPAIEKCGRAGYRWKLVGNSVTVDVAAWIGRRLRAPGSYEPWAETVLRPGSKWPRAARSDGKQRYQAPASRWPANHDRTPIQQFLAYDKHDLSARAAEGFLRRLRRSSLRMRKEAWFTGRLEAHIEKMRRREG